MSTVVLDDPASVWQDPTAKTQAWFCRRLPVRVDQSLLAELKRVAVGLGNQNVRLCLHESPRTRFHDMIILEHPGKYYRPHKHPTRSESFHAIEGTLGVFVFNAQGEVADACVLSPEGTVVYRVGVNMYHAVLPLSLRVIYHESNPGPFLGEGNSVYPDWAPDGRQPQAVTEYTKRLRNALGLPQEAPGDTGADQNQSGR
ncbi:MAG: cupin fold metalloprotein, WbuC family [Candidatus Omnitrophica bacterium]|nr:cupin fold metalloprotein, WbuC family [Candidatus Omnitrophota bacterium]